MHRTSYRSEHGVLCASLRKPPPWWRRDVATATRPRGAARAVVHAAPEDGHPQPRPVLLLFALLPGLFGGDRMAQRGHQEQRCGHLVNGLPARSDAEGGFEIL